MKCRRSLMVLVLLSATILLGLAGPASAYFNNFSSSVGPEWSATSGVLTLATAPSGQKFLGTDAQNGLTANTVTLSLASLPGHSSVTLDFDLYIIRSWDGNNTSYGPDNFKLSIQGGPTLLDTTFSNVTTLGPSFNQAFQDQNNYTGNYAPKTGAASIGSLNYPDYYGTDTTYHLVYTVPHNASSITINFENYGPNVQGNIISNGYWDESWGLDNVRVNVPVPPTMLLLGSGLLGLMGLRRFRKS
jgi:hypothetical protein